MRESADIKDPVCGKPVDPLRARAVGIYGGVTQYFCSAECKARFIDPRRTPRPDGPDRFADLEEAAPLEPMPPSPSLLVEVDGVRRRRGWPFWAAVVLMAVGLLAALLLRA